MLYRNFLLGLFFLTLSACAPMPFQNPLKQPRTGMIDEITKDKPATVYPASCWWKQYNDPQLNQLIEEGLRNAPTIALANARLMRAEAAAQIEGSSLLPAIGGEGYLQKYHQSYHMGVPPAFVPKGFQDTAKVALNFNYELDFWGKNRNKLKAATSEAIAARLEAEQAKIMLSTSIATAYANLVLYYEHKDSAAESVSLRQKTAGLFDERLTNGLENEGSVDQAKSNMAAAEAEMAALDEMIGLTRNRLAVLVGSTPLRVLSIERPKVKTIRPVTVPYPVPSDFIAHRPDLIAAKLRLEAAASRIKVAAAGFFPSIDLTGFVGRQSLGLDTFLKSGSFIGAFGPAVTLPVFQGGALKGYFKGAHAEYDMALAQYEYAIGEALYDVANAVTSQKALGPRITKTREAYEAGKRAYNVANERYKGGLANYLEVLRAEDGLIVTRRALAEIEARAFILDVALIKALGGGFVPPTGQAPCQNKE